MKKWLPMRGEWALRTHAPHHLLMESWEYMHLSILILNYSIDRLCRSVCVCSVLVCWCLFIHCWSLIWWYHIINTRKKYIKRRRKKNVRNGMQQCSMHIAPFNRMNRNYTQDGLAIVFEIVSFVRRCNLFHYDCGGANTSHTLANAHKRFALAWHVRVQHDE